MFSASPGTPARLGVLLSGPTAENAIAANFKLTVTSPVVPLAAWSFSLLAPELDGLQTLYEGPLNPNSGGVLTGTISSFDYYFAVPEGLFATLAFTPPPEAAGSLFYVVANFWADDESGTVFSALGAARVEVIPEPSTGLLVLAGMAAFGSIVRSRSGRARIV